MAKGKRIMQRACLAAKSHRMVAEAQRDLGIARFDQALGWMVDGLCDNYDVNMVGFLMEDGRAQELKRSRPNRPRRA